MHYRKKITQTTFYVRPTVGRPSPDIGVCLPTILWSNFIARQSGDRRPIDARWSGDIRPISWCKFLQNVGRLSADHRATIARRFTDDKTHENRWIGQRNFLLGCFDKKVFGRPKIQPKSVPTSADNRAMSPDFPKFCSPTVDRPSVWVMWL